VIVMIDGKLNGLLVDAVSDILTIKQTDIMPIPDTGGEAENPYLDGLISVEEDMVAMIALDRLIEKAVVH
ncbi:MAG: chemotaxis protein CheW, partial [Rhizobiales bacterium]|nr:chemotaxis protein CheW [Hyphomicrobiales bacterium]